ncbi:8-amino-7-oxononanoate synthase-like [Henckelia pumila]|uniref:8-amino-7-oxononanoate synthase-like n=1 Tax=Henckelia pumila TaxID=405737 RepID=UPI003C6E66EE
MDGDIAPMTELEKLRKKHGFLLVIDDAHATFVCGKTGGGAAEKFDCETCVDICIDTLSKAAGCQGGFIACSLQGPSRTNTTSKLNLMKSEVNGSNSSTPM